MGYKKMQRNEQFVSCSRVLSVTSTEKLRVGFFSLFFLILLAFIFDNLAWAERPAAAGKPSSPSLSVNRVIVKFNQNFAQGVQNLNDNIPSHAADKIEATLSRAGTKLLKHFGSVGISVLERTDKGKPFDEIIEILEQSGMVEYAEPDGIVHINVIPNDPMFDDLWGLNNTGQFGGNVDADIDAPEAWDLHTGDPNNIVMVVDTGVDYNHIDLAANMWVNPGETPNNNQDDDGNGYKDDIYGIDVSNNDSDPMDDHFHGTHVAGTLGAVGNNGIGITGVAQNVKIMACKFVDATGSGFITDAIECLNYAQMMKVNYGQPVKLSNNSWGCVDGSDPTCVFSQGLYDAIQAAGDNGMLFVGAAGNQAIDSDATDYFPAGFDLDNILSVAATDDLDGLAWFSNHGEISVDLGAPGVNIRSTTPGNTYLFLEGTSMASPHAAGAAALVWSQFPGLTHLQVKNLLMATVDPANALSNATVTGGRLNVFNAMTCVPGTLTMNLQTPADGFNLSLGQNVKVSANLHDCQSKITDASIFVMPTNGDPEFNLFDDGVLPDTLAGDGIYTGTWIPSVIGPVTLDVQALSGVDLIMDSVSGNIFNSSYIFDDQASYNWIDTTSSGTVILQGNMDSLATIPDIGFPFEFYGIPYTSMKVSMNGFMYFGDGNTSIPDNFQIPLPGAPDALIAPFWDDLGTTDGGKVLYLLQGNAPNRRFIIEYNNVYGGLVEAEGPVSFEVILSEGTNEVKFQYKDVIFDSFFGTSAANNGAQATVGIEDHDGLTGVQYSFNAPSLSNRMAISFIQSSSQNHTLTITGASASPNPVASGGDVNVAVNAFDSLGDPLSYSWSAICAGLPGSGSFDNSLLRDPIWTAPVNESGTQKTCALSVDVSDGQGLNQSTQFDVLVDTVPVHALTITGPSGSPNLVESGGVVTLSLTASDSFDHGLLYSWSASCPNLEAAGKGSGSFSNLIAQEPNWTSPSFTYADTGTQEENCTISVTVEDDTSELQEIRQYTQTVRAIHDVIITNPPASDQNPVASAGTVNLSVDALDTHNHALSYTWSSSCWDTDSGTFVNNENKIQNPSWTAPSNTTEVQQTCFIAVTVTDGTDNVTEQFAQKVDPSGGSNQPPTFLSDPIVEADAVVGSPYSGTIADDASDADADPLTFSKISGPAWLSVASNGTLSGTPALGDAGLNNFSVQVSDGALNDTATLQITVVQDAILPVITLLGTTPVTVEVGTPYSDAGATASDNIDGNITADIVTGGLPVDTNTPGSYSVTYDVTDSSGNAATQVTRTVNVVDTTPPNPDPMTWSQVPAATGETSIMMTASTASDLTGVEYYFDCVSAGCTDSGWQTSTVYTDTGLLAETSYSYRVQARDGEGNLTGWSSTESATTDSPPQSLLIHVGDLDATVSGNKRWTAHVTATVHYAADGLVSGAVVSGIWSDGTTSSCTTDGSGQCSVSRGTKNADITFNVTGCSGSNMTYDLAANHDDDGDSSGTGIVVFKDGSTSAPGADMTPPVITVQGDDPVTVAKDSTYIDAGATATDNMDGDITGSIVVVNPVNTGVVGAYTVTYDVTDAAGNAATQVTRTVNVVDATPQTVHIGDLDGVASGKGKWTATVFITVHNSGEGAVSGATVSGSWSDGNTSSCVTDGSGQCSVSLRTKDGIIIFSVGGVTGLNLNYNAGANHDPDGSSDGTDINLVKP